MKWQELGNTCTGGHLYDARDGTLEDINRLVFTHAIIITYGGRIRIPYKAGGDQERGVSFSITRVLNELEKEKAPALRAIYLGPWSRTSSLWMLRRGPEVPNERTNVQSSSCSAQ